MMYPFQDPKSFIKRANIETFENPQRKCFQEFLIIFPIIFYSTNILFS